MRVNISAESLSGETRIAVRQHPAAGKTEYGVHIFLSPHSAIELTGVGGDAPSLVLWTDAANESFRLLVCALLRTAADRLQFDPPPSPPVSPRLTK